MRERGAGRSGRRDICLYGVLIPLDVGYLGERRVCIADMYDYIGYAYFRKGSRKKTRLCPGFEPSLRAKLSIRSTQYKMARQSHRAVPLPPHRQNPLFQHPHVNRSSITRRRDPLPPHFCFTADAIFSIICGLSLK